MKYVYLDHNATTNLLKEVKESMISAFDMQYNPSSVHNLGRKVKSVIEIARGNILDAVGASADRYRLIFTSSGTEANNLVIHNFVDSHIFISSIEHASILKPALANQNVTQIRVDSNGLLDLVELEQELAKSKAAVKFVSVMIANNETGVIQNIQEITEKAHRYNALVHTDAVQAFGKIDLDVQDLGIDLMTISAHKCGGPLGISALIYRKNISLRAQIMGGGQERNIRSGTENVSAIVGFGRTAEIIEQILSYYSQIRNLRDLLEESIVSIVPEVIIFSKQTMRLPNTSCLTMPYIDNEVQLINFDLSGFAVSAGAACSSGKIEASTVLQAMGVDKEIAKTAIRVSLGLDTNLEMVNQFISAWRSVYNRLAVNFTSEGKALYKKFSLIENNNYIH